MAVPMFPRVEVRESQACRSTETGSTGRPIRSGAHRRSWTLLQGRIGRTGGVELIF